MSAKEPYLASPSFGPRELANFGQDVKLGLASADDVIIAAKRLEYAVFLAAGYVPPNGASEIQDYRTYALSSRFYVVKEQGEIVGMMRVIIASKAGFPTTKDFELNEIGRQIRDRPE